MSHRIRMRCAATLVFFSAAIAESPAASAVGVTNPTVPHVYAVSYVNEEWVQHPGAGGLTGFFDNTEQLVGADTITSSQKAGTDALPNPSCTPPCTAMTAEATASYVDGGVALSGFAHTYGNFDAVVTIGDPPSESYVAAYQSGNIVRAESNATVFDLLTITQPVQLDLQGHVSGNIGMTISSDSEAFAITGVDFGSGKADANLNVTLVPTPINFNTYNLVSLLLTGFDPSTPLEQDFSATEAIAPGDYLLEAELRTTTRIGTVSRSNLAVQDMHSDFGHTVTFRLVADIPEAVSSASGLLTFAPEASADVLGVAAASALALMARRRRG